MYTGGTPPPPVKIPVSQPSTPSAAASAAVQAQAQGGCGGSGPRLGAPTGSRLTNFNASPKTRRKPPPQPEFACIRDDSGIFGNSVPSPTSTVGFQSGRNWNVSPLHGYVNTYEYAAATLGTRYEEAVRTYEDMSKLGSHADITLKVQRQQAKHASGKHSPACSQQALSRSPTQSPKQSPRHSPRQSPRQSPQTSPRSSPVPVLAKARRNSVTFAEEAVATMATSIMAKSVADSSINSSSANTSRPPVPHSNRSTPSQSFSMKSPPEVPHILGDSTGFKPPFVQMKSPSSTSGAHSPPPLAFETFFRQLNEESKESFAKLMYTSVVSVLSLAPERSAAVERELERCAALHSAAGVNKHDASPVGLGPPVADSVPVSLQSGRLLFARGDGSFRVATDKEDNPVERRRSIIMGSRNASGRSDTMFTSPAPVTSTTFPTPLREGSVEMASGHGPRSQSPGGDGLYCAVELPPPVCESRRADVSKADSTQAEGSPVEAFEHAMVLQSPGGGENLLGPDTSWRMERSQVLPDNMSFSASQKQNHLLLPSASPVGSVHVSSERRHSLEVSQMRPDEMDADPSMFGSVCESPRYGGLQGRFDSFISFTDHKVVETEEMQKTLDADGNKKINQYSVVGDLGRGSYAKVKLVLHEDTDVPFALKVINKSLLKKIRKTGGTALEQARVELAIMKKIAHPRIVRLHEVIDDPTANKMYLIMDYVEGGVVAEITDDGKCEKREPKRVARYLRQIASALGHLHRHNIVHRDIKPSNILVDVHDNCFLCDFGVSSIITDSNCDVEGMEGTPFFFSPELCEGNAYIDGKASDMWSLGATAYALLLGELPFVASKRPQILDKIQNENVVIPANTDPDQRSLLRGLLNKSPKKRLTLEQLKVHPFVASGGERHPSVAYHEDIIISLKDMLDAFSLGNNVPHGDSDDEDDAGDDEDQPGFLKTLGTSDAADDTIKQHGRFLCEESSTLDPLSPSFGLSASGANFEASLNASPLSNDGLGIMSPTSSHAGSPRKRSRAATLASLASEFLSPRRERRRTMGPRCNGAEDAEGAVPIGAAARSYVHRYCETVRVKVAQKELQRMRDVRQKKKEWRKAKEAPPSAATETSTPADLSFFRPVAGLLPPSDDFPNAVTSSGSSSSSMIPSPPAVPQQLCDASPASVDMPCSPKPGSPATRKRRIRISDSGVDQSGRTCTSSVGEDVSFRLSPPVHHMPSPPATSPSLGAETSSVLAPRKGSQSKDRADVESSFMSDRMDVVSVPSPPSSLLLQPKAAPDRLPTAESMRVESCALRDMSWDRPVSSDSARDSRETRPMKLRPIEDSRLLPNRQEGLRTAWVSPRQGKLSPSFEPGLIPSPSKSPRPHHLEPLKFPGSVSPPPSSPNTARRPKTGGDQ